MYIKREIERQRGRERQRERKFAIATNDEACNLG